MKKSIVLFELIFTIIIISLVSISSLTLLFSMYEKLSFDYKEQMAKTDISSTKILFDKIFSNAKNIKVTSNTINFNKIDTKLFNLGYYSKFVDLNSIYTSRASIFSPHTKAQHLINHYITFDDKTYYEIKNDSNGEIINLENTNSKTIKEQYKIASLNHQIICKNNKLYLDNNILLKNITNCKFSFDLDFLNIYLNIREIPFKYTYKL